MLSRHDSERTGGYLGSRAPIEWQQNMKKPLHRSQTMRPLQETGLIFPQLDSLQRNVSASLESINSSGVQAFHLTLLDEEDLYHLNGREKRFYGCQWFQ
jgi:hypothetical protein